MFSAIRRHLSYANVAATLALVFSMTGGALAAKHYLINSTKQINPKVLKALKGYNGAKGTNGTNGAAGPAGPMGREAPAGKEGPPGKEGSTGKEGPTGKEGLTGKEGSTGKEGPTGKEGKEGKEGATGKTGTTGATGPTGPSDVYQERSNALGFGSKTLTLKVPAGSYAIVAKVLIYNESATVPASECILEPSDGFLDFTVGSPPHGTYASLTNVTTDTFGAESTITYRCSGGETGVHYYQMRIVATQVGAIH